MIRTAIIGCGGMGNHHAGHLAKTDGIQLTGVCDLIEEKAKSLGERIGAPWCTGFRELLDRVDAVWVCTEPFNRLDIVTASAAAGKHIFTEKPICVDAGQADEMIAAAREVGDDPAGDIAAAIGFLQEKLRRMD